MLILNELHAKASLVKQHRKILSSLRKKVKTPEGFTFTVYDHTDPIGFSFHQGIKRVEFEWVGHQLVVTEFGGMTGVDAYILAQEFKTLNS